MTTPRACPRCYAPLRPSESPEGLCPKCLLAVAMGEDAVIRTHTGKPIPPPPTPEELAPHFPGLRIAGLIGRGGAGAVYRALQTDLGRQVALKVLLLDPELDPTFGERFVREARAMASLAHPGIAAVHDAGRAGPHWFLVMEFVDGPNLRQVIQSRDMAASDALDIVRQICDALEYAHGEGVVHRDIKPENVLLDARGRVKLVDFGLAKLLGPDLGGATLTRSSQAMGTWHYIAPEQLRRPLEVDHRADIYSLGVVFYELLTGEVPQGRYAPASERARLDRRIDAIVDRALEQDPARRYQRASGVRDDVERVQAGPAPEPVTPTPQPEPARAARSGVGTTLLGCLGLLALGFAAMVVMYLGLSVRAPSDDSLQTPDSNGGRALYELAARVDVPETPNLAEAAERAYQAYSQLERERASVHAFRANGDEWLQVEIAPFVAAREMLIDRFVLHSAIPESGTVRRLRVGLREENALPSGTEQRVLVARIDGDGRVTIRDGETTHRTRYRSIRTIDPRTEVVFDLVPTEDEFRAQLAKANELPWSPERVGVEAAPALALEALARVDGRLRRILSEHETVESAPSSSMTIIRTKGYGDEFRAQRAALGSEIEALFGPEFRQSFLTRVDWEKLAPFALSAEVVIEVSEVDGVPKLVITRDGDVESFFGDEIPWHLQRYVHAHSAQR